jgi:hypothetical protein
MAHQQLGIRSWAREEFGRAALGDPRRTRRVVEMAAGVAKAPSGRVSSVFVKASEQQAAYDLLEHKHVEASSLIEAAGKAAAARSAAHDFVYVPIDGSSLTLVDKKRTKGFGAIGAGEFKAAGMKVITAEAIDPSGAPVGMLAQRWWARPPRMKAQKKVRPTHKKETQHWLDVVDDVRSRCQQAGAKAWVQIDREGDARPLLMALAQTGQFFTIRSSWDRRLWDSAGQRRYISDEIEKCAIVASYDVNVPGTPRRKAHIARMQVRAMTVDLRLCNKWTKTAPRKFPVTIIEAREYGTAVGDEEPLYWRLLTNYPVQTDGDLLAVIRGYTQRWRIRTSIEPGSAAAATSRTRNCEAHQR